MTLLIMAVGVFLPMGPLADYIKLQALPWHYFVWLIWVLLGYAVLTSMKRYYICGFGWQKRGSRPSPENPPRAGRMCESTRARSDAGRACMAHVSVIRRRRCQRGRWTFPLWWPILQPGFFVSFD